MGLEKIGMTLAQRAASWVKSAGKTSVLETKPLQGKINTKELGYINSNGNIVFGNQQAAQKYAKNRIQKALHAEKPFERGLFVDKNVVLEEINGNKTSINLLQSKTFKNRHANFATDIKADETIEFIHGHPDIWGKGHTTPLSAGDGFTYPSDYAVMIGCNLKKMTAYNSKGEFNSITWLGNKTKQEAFTKHGTDYWNYLAKLLNKEGYNHYKDFSNRVINHVNKYGSPSKELMQENESIILKIMEKANAFFNTERGTKIYHKLWQKNATEYGVDYSTNFSNLV